MSTTDTTPPATSSSFPLNRIVAFLGPYIALASGAIVDWLFVHLNFLANWHTSHSAITTWLTQAGVFGLTSLLVWLGQQQWLKGWQTWEAISTQIAATPVPLPLPPAPAPEGQAKPNPATGGTK